MVAVLTLVDVLQVMVSEGAVGTGGGGGGGGVVVPQFGAVIAWEMGECLPAKLPLL